MADEHENTSRQDLRALLRALRARAVLVVVCVVVAGAAAYAYSSSQPNEYTASASLLFRDARLDQTLFGSSYFTNNDPTREAATNVRLVSLEVIAARTAKALGPGWTAAAVQSRVAVAEEGQASVVSITATDRNPALAARIPNEFARQYIAFRRDADRAKVQDALRLVLTQIKQLSPAAQSSEEGNQLRSRAQQLRILSSLQTGNAELVQPAVPPTAASSPTPTRDGIIGAILGLILGVVAALVLERMDRRLKDPQAIGDAFDRPVLGAIPESRVIAKRGFDPQSLTPAEAEAFRMLRANLRYFNVDREIRSVLITSASPGDGKSTVALHLAAAAAGTGTRVLLIEADLRHPTLAARIGARPHLGLSQLLAGQAVDIEEAAYRVAVSARTEDGDYRTMDVIVSGPIPPNPTDLIESARMRDLLARAQEEYDLVVVDTPPTSIVSDAIPLVSEVSGVLAVCRLGKTTRESALHLASQLQRLDANVLGVVVNAVGRGRRGSYGYGYGYGSGYGYGAEDSRRPKKDATPLPAPEPISRRRNGSAPADVPGGVRRRSSAATTLIDEDEERRGRR
jgi:receptor protein-tyrosine kinase